MQGIPFWGETKISLICEKKSVGPRTPWATSTAIGFTDDQCLQITINRMRPLRQADNQGRKGFDDFKREEFGTKVV